MMHLLSEIRAIDRKVCSNRKVTACYWRACDDCLTGGCCACLCRDDLRPCAFTVAYFFASYRARGDPYFSLQTCAKAYSLPFGIEATWKQSSECKFHDAADNKNQKSNRDGYVEWILHLLIELV